MIAVIDGTAGTKAEGDRIAAQRFPFPFPAHCREVDGNGKGELGRVRAAIRRRPRTEAPCAPRGCVLAHKPQSLDARARHTDGLTRQGRAISAIRVPIISLQGQRKWVESVTFSIVTIDDGKNVNPYAIVIRKVGVLPQNL